MRILSDEQRLNLKNYKYCGVDHSIVSRYILTPYWNWLVTLFPMWMAPNLITLIGFSIMVFNLGLQLYYSSDLSEACPNWVYFCCAIGLFAYQSLDSIDGKQARRTKSSSPLGELFDHGCDALNTTVSTILGASALNLKQSWLLTISVISTVANFYLSSWEEYYTKVLYLSYVSGPVEGILSAIAAFIVAGIKGPAFFDTPIQQLLPGVIPASIPVLPLNTVLVGFGMFICALNIVFASLNVFKKVWSRKESTLPCLWNLQLLVVWILALVTWMQTSPAIRMHAQVPVLLTLGLAFGHSVGQIILAHLTSSPFPDQSTITILLIWFGLIPTIVLQGATLSAKGVFYVSPSVYPLFSKVLIPAFSYVGITSAMIGNTLASFLTYWKQATDFVWPIFKQLHISPQLPKQAIATHISFNPTVFQMQVSLIYLLFIVAFLWYLVSALCVINEICAVFDINCLSIKKSESKTDSKKDSKKESKKTQ